ncbi:MAG: NAD-dependent epimerase/dehydratase family protein, partial [Brachymonas denitrificans]
LAHSLVHLAPPGTASPTTDPRIRALIAALRRGRLPQRVVYGSTSGVYGNRQGRWTEETTQPAPLTARAQRRVDAEQALRQWGRAGQGLPAVRILRIPGIYAPDREGGTPRERLQRGTPVLAQQDDVFTNHIHADDLARACLRALWKGAPQRIYNANDDSCSRMGDYFDMAADLYGLPRPPRLPLAQAREQLPPTLLSFMQESRRLHNRRLKRELGLVLRYPTPEQGLRV